MSENSGYEQSERRIRDLEAEVSRLRHAKESLREGEQRFRELFENSRDGFVVVDADGSIVDANPAYCDMLGYSLNELRTLEDFYCITPERWRDREATEIWEKRLMGYGYSGLYEKEYIRKDGTVFPVELRSYAIRREDGAIDYLWGTARDITERKRAEAALRESEERNRLLSDVTLEGILIHKNAVAMDLNASLAQMLGFDRQELLGKDFMSFVHEDDRALVRVNIVKDIAPPYTIRMVRRNGGHFFAEIESRNFEKQGDVWRVSAVRDITKRKLAEEEHEKLQAQLIQAQKMESVGRLAGGVAHDFNNMLAVILGQTEMALMKVPPTESLHRKLLQIQQSAEHSAVLVRQLLAFARKQIVAPVVLDLNDRVGRMLKMLRRLIGEDIDLVWAPGAELGPTKMDPSQID